METILVEALKFIGVSISGGLAWDVIKMAGGNILSGFKKHFTIAKYFKDENQAEEFMKYISSKESLNKRRPLEDAWSIYDNCTGMEASDLFKEEFVEWLKEYGKTLKNIKEDAQMNGSVTIHKQINKDNSQVINIGSQYNYGNGNEYSDK